LEAYAHFRLARQAIPCSKATMLTYEYTLGDRYVRLAMDRDLGRLEDWAEFIAIPLQIGLRGLRP